MVRDGFRDRIQQLEPASKATVFRGLDEMISLHQTVLADLRHTKNDVGRVLMKNFEGFSVYRDYCVKLGRAQAILQAEELRY